jgi:hypothetical protein
VSFLELRSVFFASGLPFLWFVGRGLLATLTALSILPCLLAGLMRLTDV